MEDTRLIQSIRLQNILSYGPDTPAFELGPLNVLIGPNASGKSNLIEVLSLLAAAPKDLQEPIQEGGGVKDWLWKGKLGAVRAEVDVTITYTDRFAQSAESIPLRHKFIFTEEKGRFLLHDESIESERPFGAYTEPYIYYAYQSGRPVINIKSIAGTNGKSTKRDLRREDVSPEQSILSQRRDPDIYPELTYLAHCFGQIHLYREWNLGRYTAPRVPQKPDLPSRYLLEDASNLALVLNNLEARHYDSYQLILKRLKAFYDRITGISVSIIGGTVQIIAKESGLAHPIPATRLSDGTLRYLCLLAVLCHPEPPPLICIEEPELGLHPDVIPTVAEMLIEASQRTQLIVTTHSDILIDALSSQPDAVVVCERDDQGTTLRRLDAGKLAPWLEKYRLGELWTSGEIGGTRW